MGLQVVVQVVKTHARLQQHGAVLDIHLDLLHAREVDDDRAGPNGSRSAITQVLAAAYRPDGHFVGGGHAHQRLHLLGGRGGYRSGGPVVARVDGKAVAVTVAVFLGVEDSVCPDDTGKGFERARQGGGIGRGSA